MPTLDWIGKDKIVNHHLEVAYHVLDKQYSYGANDSENMIIHGDNLIALKALLPKYEGKVKCIYIDPPYNTGNENWVYNDNINDPTIKKWLGQVVGSEFDDLTRHDKWLCMMYPRLQLLHKLLSIDGAIFISVDDNEVYSLKLICDEIFGKNNFISDVVWQHSIQPKGYLGDFSLHHNYTLIYKKSDAFQLGSLERTEEDNKQYKNPDNDPRGLWRKGDVRNALYRPNLIYDIETPSGKVIHAPENGWRWSKETVAEKMKTGEIIFNEDETNIIRKIYLDTVEGRAPESIWFGKDVGTTRTANAELKEIFPDEKIFDTPKPTGLIMRILQLMNDKDAIVLDSFAGSGTTAHAVLKKNAEDGGKRKFIMIELGDYAETTTAERIKRVINGYGEGKKTVKPIDDSFSYYELGEAIIRDDELNPNIPIETIKEFVYYLETKREYKKNADEKSLLGINAGCAYYFFYEQGTTITLNRRKLSCIKTKAESYVIYADQCTLSDEELKKYNITFKKTSDIGKI